MYVIAFQRESEGMWQNYASEADPSDALERVDEFLASGDRFFCLALVDGTGPVSDSNIVCRWMSGWGMKRTLAKCANCGLLFEMGDIRAPEDVSDLGRRLDPGSEVPAGECPECRAFCYLLKGGEHDEETEASGKSGT